MGLPEERHNEYKSKVKLNKHSMIQDLTGENISSGIIASTMVMTGPALIILQAAAAGGFTDQQTINWMFAVYFFGGVYSILMPLLYRIPIAGGHSITGVAFLATITAQYTYPELIGGYVMSGLLIFLVGISGLFTKIIGWVPKEVIASMLGGLVAGYVVKLVPAIQEMPLVGGAALISFLFFTRYVKKFPPVLAAVVAAFTVLFFTADLNPAKEISYFLPSWQTPEFTWMGLVTIALPLAMLILSNDAAPGIGALESSNFKPPIRKIVSSSGVFSVITSFFGGQCANIAGMMSAICAGPDSGPREKRYMGAVVAGAITIVFGIFAWKIVPFIQSLPQAFVSLLAGFALIGVLHSSLQMGFSGNRYRLSALAAFIVTLSGISILHISAPVWGLVAGAVLARTVER
ncbi:benzoate/H(+) symporter BenE family transporter [Bacillus sp. ISL-47]|uniref:benzoate/H(+) symporter BenE family transporter n=1 Tax=Bacillus sp. ISL-47 TaxID=2819130 RepID=UPI001BEC4787|nr:benzoate/H(+) symporter BenE family transporter [Bacillus sp. ISL-47]MBT2690195.1 benzoate/H(+) symporter BenE family transporter [Bacillus sp. ISL-47]MBT2710356.1 benzoate/H(+) symporter BenE family transporter [Pseudomonas sp. ISL-84]